MPLAGGIMQNGYQCGMVWGAGLACGAEAFYRLGYSPEAEAGAIEAARKMVEVFGNQNSEVDCFKLTGIDNSVSSLQMMIYFFVKGGTIRCLRKAFRFAPEAWDRMNSTLDAPGVELPARPVSCTALLAQKMGASEQHQVMAAGLAGGIGLCGGACGALGTAIWLTLMKKLRAGSVKLAYQDPDALDLIKSFKKLTGNEFECTRIVGQRFSGVGKHAAYLKEGGCAELIDRLSAP